MYWLLYYGLYFVIPPIGALFGAKRKGFLVPVLTAGGVLSVAVVLPLMHDTFIRPSDNHCGVPLMILASSPLAVLSLALPLIYRRLTDRPGWAAFAALMTGIALGPVCVALWYYGLWWFCHEFL